MNLLEEIVKHKKKEVGQARERMSIPELIKLPGFAKQTKSFKEFIKNGSGIIAEFKKKSPSAGAFDLGMKMEEVLMFYKKHQVSGVSILTDEKYFGGNVENLVIADALMDVPVLRKDFIVDEYQLFEAKAYGADVILLIAEALDEYHATYLATIAKSLGLEVLMEFHGVNELKKYNENVDVLGINNRNLKTLKTDIRTSFDLMKHLPYDSVKIAESGITSPYEITELLKAGYDGFLIGESVLKNKHLLTRFNEAIVEFKTVGHAN